MYKTQLFIDKCETCIYFENPQCTLKQRTVNKDDSCGGYSKRYKSIINNECYEF